MQFHVEVPVLAGLDIVSVIIYAACLVPLHLNFNWCRFLFWGSIRTLGYKQHLLLLLLFFLLFFLLRAADAISCGGVCSAICGCCFCNSICCLSCSCAFKLQFLLWVSFGPCGVSSICYCVGLLMQFHVEMPVLAGLDTVSAILCNACLVPAHLNCSWCRFLLWV